MVVPSNPSNRQSKSFRGEFIDTVLEDMEPGTMRFFGWVVLIVIVWQAVSLFFSAWILMLISGAIHADLWSDLPAFSYWQSVLLVVGISVLRWGTQKIFR